MKIFQKNSLIIPLALTGALFLTPVATPVAIAAAPSVNVSVKVSQSAQTGVDWTKGKDSVITAKGLGLPKNGSTALARVAATMDAQRNLLSIIRGIQLDADTLMEDLMVKSDVVKRNIAGTLKGAKIISEGENPDGSYYVVMQVPLYGSAGSLASAAFSNFLSGIEHAAPPVVNRAETPLPQETVQSIDNTNYTGVVIDADGLGLEPTFSPAIYDTNGRAIYGVENINPDFAVSEGMVNYADTVADATANSRAGDNPLVVRAESVKGGAGPNTVNAVVSVEDGDRILLANEKSKMLDNCAVVMVK